MDKNELETNDDNFEYLEMENLPRFKQFQKILKNKPNAMNMSIRVVIDETDYENPKIIDY